MKEFGSKIRYNIVKYCSIIFPILVFAIVGATVYLALCAHKTKEDMMSHVEESSQENVSADAVTNEGLIDTAKEVPMKINEDERIQELLETYLGAVAIGDMNTIRVICDGVPEQKAIVIVELAKYTESISLNEIYTKQGYDEDSVLAFVCYSTVLTEYSEIAIPAYEAVYIDTDEDGRLYIKMNGDNFTEEENEYIQTAAGQVDVIELFNRVNVQYNEVGAANPELVAYIDLLESHVNEYLGDVLAAQYADNSINSQGIDPEDPAEGVIEVPEPVEEGPAYAYAKTGVNVRNSDSENADKLGQVNEGARLQIIEVQVNGWTKVVYEKKEGFVKTEFLQMEEKASDFETIGTIEAKTTVNVRMAATQNSAKLGMLAKGATAELIAVEGDWCKIKFDNRVAYVKGEYVTQR